MLHYARYGESFGYALAEAAIVGLPVVAQATPWGDNAQLELVRHGETGFVATGYEQTRLYLQQTLADPQLAAAFGRAGRDHVVGSFGIGETWRLLRAFMSHVQAGGTGLLTAPTDLAADAGDIHGAAGPALVCPGRVDCLQSRHRPPLPGTATTP